MKNYIPTSSIFLSEEKIFDDQIRWEYLKYEIRKFSIHFFISEAKKRRYGKTRVTSWKFKSASSNPRVTSSNPQATNSNPRVKSSNQRVTNSNPRFTSSNPQVQESSYQWKLK